MNQSLLVTKRDGAKERIPFEKLYRVINQVIQETLSSSAVLFALDTTVTYPQSKKSSETIFNEVNTLGIEKHSILSLLGEDLSITELLKAMCKLARSPPKLHRIKKTRI